MELSRRSVTGLLAVLLACCSNGEGPTDAGDGDADADGDTGLVALVLAGGDEADPPLTLLAIDLDTDQVLATLEMPGASWGDMDASPTGDRVAVVVGDPMEGYALLLAYDDGGGAPTLTETARVDRPMEQVALGIDAGVYFFRYDEVGLFNDRGEIEAQISLVPCGADEVYPALTWIEQDPSSESVLVTAMTDDLTRLYVLDPDDLECARVIGLYEGEPTDLNYKAAQLALVHDGALAVMRAYWRESLLAVDLSSGLCTPFSQGEWQEPVVEGLVAHSSDRVVALLAASCDQACDEDWCFCSDEGSFHMFSLQQYTVDDHGSIAPDLLAAVPLACPPAAWEHNHASDWPLVHLASSDDLLAACGSRAEDDDDCPLRVYLSPVRGLPRPVGCGALRGFDHVSDVALIQRGRGE